MKIIIYLFTLTLFLSFSASADVIKKGVKHKHPHLPHVIQNSFNEKKSIRKIDYKDVTESISLRLNMISTIVVPNDIIAVSLGDTKSIYHKILNKNKINLVPLKHGIDTNLQIITTEKLYNFYLTTYSVASKITPDLVVYVNGTDTQKNEKKLEYLKSSNDYLKDIGSFKELNTQYKISLKNSKSKSISPTHAYDDGYQTYLHFPKDFIGKRISVPYRIINGIDGIANWKLVNGNVMVIEGINNEGWTLKNGKDYVCIRPKKSLTKTYKDINS